MTKLIWMTDPHFQNAGRVDSIDPRERLRAALEHANTQYADARAILLTGDLVGDDIEGDYALLAEYLAASDLPVLPLVGNNDHRAGFRRHLTLPDTAMPDFVQYTVDLPETRVICLDTHDPGTHAGRLCAARLGWLDQQLSDASSALIFMHHPPMALGLPKQDEIMLQEPEPFWDLVLRHGNVQHLCMGHVHRPTCGVHQGLPFATLGALSFQAPAPRPAWDWDSFQPAPEPPHYAVLEVTHKGVTIQHIQFCTAGFATI